MKIEIEGDPLTPFSKCSAAPAMSVMIDGQAVKGVRGGLGPVA